MLVMPAQRKRRFLSIDIGLESAQIDEYEQGKGRSKVCERAAKWNLISFISRK